MPISAPKPNSPPSANWVDAYHRQHDRRIDLVETVVVADSRHNRIGVVRTVIMNMRDRFVDAVDDLAAMVASSYSVSQSAAAAGFTRGSVRCTASSPAHLAAGVDQHLDQRLEGGRCTGAVDQQGFGGAADAGAGGSSRSARSTSPFQDWRRDRHRRD